MFVKYVLLVNKQGQTRVSQYYEHLDLDERATLEPDIVRRCLSRSAGLVRRMIDDQWFREWNEKNQEQYGWISRSNVIEWYRMLQYHDHWYRDDILLSNAVLVLWLQGPQGRLSSIRISILYRRCRAGYQWAQCARVHPFIRRDARPVLWQCRTCAQGWFIRLFILQ